MGSRVLTVGMSEIIGGVEREILAVISRCRDTSFDFLCYGSDYPYENELPECRFFYLPYRRRHYFESQRKLKEFLKTHGNEYDLIWVNTSSASNMSVQRIAKRYTSARVITHSHSSRIEHEDPFLRTAHEILHKLNQRKLVKSSDILVACSESAAEHLFGKAHSKAHIVYNGIDTERFAFDENSRQLKRKELGISDSSTVLCCIGRLEAVKNIRFAVKVFTNYQELTANEDVYLLLVGDGSERRELEDLAATGMIGNIRFLGAQNDVKPFLDASDILLMPSFFEGFPVSAIEAQANGLVCLLSDRITREAAVTDLVSFLGIEEKDITLWTEAITANKEKRDRTAYAAAVAEKGLDIDAVARKMEDIFCNR